MASKGSWAGGKAPAQGSASTGQKDSGGIVAAFSKQAAIDCNCCGQGCACCDCSGFAPGFKRP